ncbi:TonB-dependent siderophore receptor [Pelagibius sp.]|uniref:TonB-dependent siderophore receptor n=1 Tax=Pelagibius sp. TaxID=1931238 RepID=UPI003BB19DFF
MGSETGAWGIGRSQQRRNVSQGVTGKRLCFTAATITALSIGATFSATTPAAARDQDPSLSIAQADAVRDFSIEEQPLNTALDRFSDQAGIFFAYKTGDLSGLRSRGVSGTYSAADALRVLLAGTGISFKFTDANTVTLERNASEEGSGPMRLGAVVVEGTRESPYGPVDGYVANRSATGTKTNTPIIETPQSISVVTRDQMDARAVQNVGEAVQYNAGVRSNLQAESSGLAGSNITVRGFGGDGTAGTSGNEYVDGLRVRGTDFAAAGFEPYLFERVEILKGPSSVLYGQTTPAGVINHVSKRPTEESFYEIQGEVGSFNRFEGAFDFGGAVDDERQFLFRLTGLALDTESQTDFTGRDRKVIAPAFTWRPTEDTTLTLLTTYQDDDFEGGFVNRVPAFGTIFPNPNGEIADDFFQGDPNFNSWDRELFSIGYQFEHHFDETWTLRQNARYLHNDLELQAIFGTLQADLRTLNRSSFSADETSDDVTIDTHVEARFETDPISHTVLLGLDYQTLNRHTDRRLGTVATIDLFNPVYNLDIPALTPFQRTETDEEQIGVYVQDQIRFDNWIMTLGGRYDWSSIENENQIANTSSKQSDRAFSGRAGVGYVFDIGLAPYISYSESFQPQPGVDAQGSAFDPTTGTQFEAGIKFQPNDYNALATLAAFQLTQQNVLTSDPDNPGDSIQTGEIRSRGVEIEATASFDNGISLLAAYTYQDLEITEDNDGNAGNTPAGAADHWASIWGDYTIQEGDLAGLGAGVGVRYVGSSAGNVENTFEAPGYTLVDAAIRYDLGGIAPALTGSQFALSATNIFDKRYVASCARIDRCFQGVGRSVLATLRFRW